jgi:hypothetical protein
MSFKIKQAKPEREASGNYRYIIFQDGHLVAHYWHDFRGDEHGIEFLSGKSEDWPVGRMIDFIEGGGPQPLTLSSAAVAYLQQKLGN